ncbi:hypothetical protein B4U79_10416 [Dinothrombium tinctorium]|uniref:BAG family molecular chaperone regulator 2-like protein n=1 Tax=Dinothrombium tinctorium TaxID=1965070 RepID=A0A443RRQ0_9ACAR|nr:hypothetical protein B4U79_10416 [Dinothrombium tinctorium]
MEKPSRLRFMRESITNILDQIDARVSFLRETAIELDEEKRKLFNVLTSIKTTNDLSLLSEVDKEEILATSDRMLCRLNSVEIQVITTRDEDQVNALQTVNMYIDNLVEMFKQNANQAIHLGRMYLNTCSSESNVGIVDEKFQKAIIACTADDQKKIRKRLESLLMTFSHAKSSNQI